MKRSMVIAFLAVAMMLPGVASATVLTGVAANGDCDGWSLEVALHWGATTYEANLDYVVTLTDLDGRVLEEAEFNGVLTRPQGSGLNEVVMYSGTWQNTYYAPGFMLTGDVRLVGPHDHTMLTFSRALDCTVAAEGVSWSTLKAIYR